MNWIFGLSVLLNLISLTLIILFKCGMIGVNPTLAVMQVIIFILTFIIAAFAGYHKVKSWNRY